MLVGVCYGHREDEVLRAEGGCLELGKLEDRRRLLAALGSGGPEYYHELVNPYFISLSKQVRLCPECHSKTVLEPSTGCPNLAMEICTNEGCDWAQGMMPPKSMLVPEGYGLPGGKPAPGASPAPPEGYEGPSPMQMVFRHNAAVAAAEQARYGTGAPDPELEELERIESEWDERPRKKAKVLKFRPKGSN